MEQEKINKLNVVEKQKYIAAGVPFKVLSKEPFENWKTNYAYYLKQVKAGAAVRPLIGRMNEEQFQVYNNGVWENSHLWNDWSQPMLDKDGEVVMGANGKPRKQLLFDQKFDLPIEFDEPVPVEYYDKELKQSVSETLQTFKVRLSKSLKDKILKEVNDPRSPDGSKFMVTFDKTKSPADMYEVSFHS